MTEELLAEVDLGEEIGRESFADLAYRSEQLEDDLAECGIRLVTEPSRRRHGRRQQIETPSASLKRAFVSARPWPPRS